MSFHTWMLFATAYLVTTISPGPNVLLVIRNTVRYGTAGTAATIGGNLCAQLVVVVLVALGVGAVLAALPALFTVMKVIGAAYLIWLGIRQFRRAGSGSGRAPTPGSASGSASAASAAPAAAARTQIPDSGKLFREALLVSGSNPKTLIFLSAFMPQFIAHDRPLGWQFAIMYLTVAAIVAIVHTVYSVGVRGVHDRLGASRWLEAVKRAGGLVFFALGIKLLTTSRA